MTATLVPPARATREDVRTSRVHGVRRLAASLLLVAFAFVQQPGYLVPDTKFDLLVDPGRFLSDSWQLWDPTGASGQLRNQAYGYLFPMGPFFLLGHLLQIPAWMIQRAWWALVMVVAFNGFCLLAARLGIGTPTTRLIAGLAYALSPRLVGAIGAISIEVWPLAVAPWVLVPLVQGSVRGSPRTAAARSGLAVLCVGGVNAVATMAVLPLAAWWLITRTAGTRRRQLLMWWTACVGMATFWWVVPLLLLGRYSPPFLDWIEGASVTTGLASPGNALRGTTHWIAYLASSAGPQWPAGFALVHEPALVLATGLVAALGLAGLCWPRVPHRGFLLGGLVMGLALVTFGHVGAADGLFAVGARGLLDSSLAAFRNTHKFDLVVRIPLMLGLAHILSVVRLRPVQQLPGVPFAARALAVVAIAAAAAPAVAGVLPQPGAFREIPDHWRATAAWLDRQPGTGRTLVVPGSATASFVWGTPRDDPMQMLANRPWTVRDHVPLGSAGNTRMLNAVETAVTSGQGSTGLAPFLARSGIEFVVVRNDLNWRAAGAPQPVVVHQALARSAGMSYVRSFGPIVGGLAPPGSYVEGGLDLPFRAVDVWQVRPYRAQAELWSTKGSLRVSGGPESVLALAERGWGTNRPIVLSGDDQGSGLSPTAAVVTDTFRRRENNFAAVRGGTSGTLTADEPFDAPRPVHDYLPFAPEGHQAVAVYEGVRRLSASSSGSDAGAVRERGPDRQPFAAFDGDPETAWRSGAFRGAVGEWLQVDFTDRPAPASVLMTVTDEPGVATLSRVRVSTRRGSLDTEVGPAGEPSELPVPAGSTSWLRVTVLATAGEDRLAAGISELVVPGLSVRRDVVLPNDQRTAAKQAVVIDVPPGRREACAFAGDRPLCTSRLARDGEETAISRVVDTPRTKDMQVSGIAWPRPGPALNRFLEPLGDAIHARASSVQVDHPAGRPQSAVDRDLGTGWVAAADDKQPTLTLTWPGVREISVVQLLVDPALASSRPRQVVVRAAGGEQDVAVDPEGYLRFDPIRTDKLVLVFGQVDRRDEIGPLGGRTALPVGVSEVRIPGVDALRRGPDPGAAVRIPCGFAPTILVDDRPTLTEATGTVRDLLQLRPLVIKPCVDATVDLAAGTHRIEMSSTAEMRPGSVTLDPGLARAERVAPPVVRQWRAESRVVDVATSDSQRVLVVHENANPGWTAQLGGRPLRSVRIDGWQQGWIVPAGASGSVMLTFGPATPYRSGLLLGAALAVLLLALALMQPRAASSVGPVVETRRLRLISSLLAVLLVATFGVTALAGLALGAVLAVLVRRGGRELPALVAGVCAFAAAGLVALAPWPDATSLEWHVQVLTVLGVCIAVVTGWFSAPGFSGAGPAAPRSSSLPRQSRR
jgi:arabinofuranan 3-O-arabinosyltransferase